MLNGKTIVVVTSPPIAVSNASNFSTSVQVISGGSVSGLGMFSGEAQLQTSLNINLEGEVYSSVTIVGSGSATGIGKVKETVSKKVHSKVGKGGFGYDLAVQYSR